MLVLTRKLRERIVIRLGGQTVIVQIVDIERDRVRVGLTAPASVTIHREEVARRIKEWQEDLEAADRAAADNQIGPQ